MPRSLEDLSAQVAWPMVKEYFDRFGDAVLYGTLKIYDKALLPESLVEPYLVEKMAAEGFTELGEGGSLSNWIVENYR